MNYLQMLLRYYLFLRQQISIDFRSILVKQLVVLLLQLKVVVFDLLLQVERKMTEVVDEYKMILVDFLIHSAVLI